ncbi:MAG: hypothetical protein HY744_13175 [Deltaproteobacteria bacterium]|nr:hypothetical protein [Deltaproteobacteria bacterium]
MGPSRWQRIRAEIEQELADLERELWRATGEPAGQAGAAAASAARTMEERRLVVTVALSRIERKERELGGGGRTRAPARGDRLGADERAELERLLREAAQDVSALRAGRATRTRDGKDGEAWKRAPAHGWLNEKQAERGEAIQTDGSLDDDVAAAERPPAREPPGAPTTGAEPDQTGEDFGTRQKKAGFARPAAKAGVEPSAKPEAAAVVGSAAPPAGVMAVLTSHVSELAGCLPEKLRTEGPVLLQVQARLTDEGRLREIDLGGPADLPPSAEACLQDALARIGLPAPGEGGGRPVAFTLWLTGP